MPETQPEEKRTKIIPMTLEDFIWMQLKDFKDEFRDSRKELAARMDRLENQFRESRKELSDRMDRLEARQDKLETKLETVRQELNDRMDKLDAKIDKLAEKMDSSNKHGNIMTASAISIAVGVLYALFFK